MRAVEAGMPGGTYGDVSVRHRIGDFGLSMFHRLERRYRPAPSSLSRLGLPGLPGTHFTGEP